LRRSPWFTLLTVVVLSGGLGLSIFTFSFLHTAMLKPLPLSGGDRIVSLHQTTRGSSSSFDIVDVTAVRPSITSLVNVGAFTDRSIVIGDDRHRRVLGATATEPNMFTLTRTPPMLGRVFLPVDQLAGAEPVIVLSHDTWETVFGGDSAIVNKTVPLNGAYTRVIGVMPPGYGFPVASDAWIPLGADVLATRTAGSYDVYLYARLADGVTADRATTELRQLLSRSIAARRQASDPTTAPVDVAIQTFPMAQMGEQGSARAHGVESHRDAHPAARMYQRREPLARARERARARDGRAHGARRSARPARDAEHVGEHRTLSPRRRGSRRWAPCGARRNQRVVAEQSARKPRVLVGVGLR
jgi:hypothetical protein